MRQGCSTRQMGLKTSLPALQASSFTLPCPLLARKTTLELKEPALRHLQMLELQVRELFALGALLGHAPGWGSSFAFGCLPSAPAASGSRQLLL